MTQKLFSLTLNICRSENSVFYFTAVWWIILEVSAIVVLWMYVVQFLLDQINRYIYIYILTGLCLSRIEMKNENEKHESYKNKWQIIASNFFSLCGIIVIFHIHTHTAPGNIIIGVSLNMASSNRGIQMGSAWFQRKVNLRPQHRGVHLVTEEILRQMPEICQFSVGLFHVQSKLMTI